MFRYYLKTAFREIKKHSGFTALNVIGLTLGIASCLLIILYVNSELSFDKFHKNRNNIYRVVMQQPGNLVRGSTSDWWIVSPYILKPTWEKELPEVELACRIREDNLSFKNNDQYVNEDILIVDPEFLDVFTFPMKSGNKKVVLANPFSIVISHRMALKYFGKDDPIGKSIVTNDGQVFNVTGVLEKIPENSHLKFDFLISFNTLQAIRGESLVSNNWLNNGYRTYVVLKGNTNLIELDSKLHKYDIDGFNGKKWSFHLQPLADIHFNRQIRGTGDKETVLILISVGFFILLITGFNYMNLYIAHYRSLTKNIGIRRFSGADRTSLVQQFLSETVLIVFISYLASLIIVWFALPLFNDFTGEQLEFRLLWIRSVLAGTMGILLFMAFIAGMYPALYLSGLQVINGIKGGMEKFSKGAMILKKGIMVIQFSVSIMLVVGTITIYKQLSYVSHKNLGYNKESILFMNLNGIWYKDADGTWKSRLETLKQELLKNSDIIKVSASSGIPSQIGWSNIPVWEGQTEGDNPFFYRLSVDENFFDLYGLEIIQGRAFSADMPGDKGSAYILNESAAMSLGFKNPVGSRFGFDKKIGTVVGVVKDFHFESLHKPITPLGIGFSGNNFNYLSLRISTRDVPQTLKYIEKVWGSLTNNLALKYTFIEDQLTQLYRKDDQLAESLNWFSFIALFVSCLGIFGLMSISIKEKTKEFGIRKIVGAPFLNLVMLLLKDNLIIIIIASFVGGVSGGYLADKWLNNFAFRINFGFEIIIISSLIALFMAVIPVSYMLWKAVSGNPVESLRAD